ncbi:MAG: glutamate--tRNA ligase [Calditrichaceae bacterium]
MGEIVRFAPSPTGHLHIGGARTAIFNWLIARKANGKFLLRIEDTDFKRSSNESIEQILSGLEWLGLDWDEPVYFQSQNVKQHVAIIDRLLKTGRAYRCFCSKEELAEKRLKAEQESGGYRYDQSCRFLGEEEINHRLARNIPFSVRLKIEEAPVEFNDMVIGSTKIDAGIIDDFIILRSDGSPVYQLAVVVDDHNMGITMVIRGADHLSNTYKQILIYNALNWNCPQFGHVPLILGVDKKRLSKRHGAASVAEFKHDGILPDALFNYLCLLGWSPGDDTEIMTKTEIIEKFDYARINKSPAVFDPKKLKWFNSKYISQIPVNKLLPDIKDICNKNHWILKEEEEDRFRLFIKLYKSRSAALNDLFDTIQVYFVNPEHYDEKGINKYFSNNTMQTLLVKLYNTLETVGEDPFKTIDSAEKFIRAFADQNSVAAAKIIHPLRLSLTGKIESPGIFELLFVLGKTKTLERLKKALEFIDSKS